MAINKTPVERIYLEDKKIKPQTIAHHVARYNFASKIRKVGRVNCALDLACGSGYGTDILRKAGYRVLGIDNNHESIFFAKKQYPKCDFIMNDLNNFRIPERYNLIVLFEAIEHLRYDDGIQLLNFIKRLLCDEKSLFVLSTPRDINGKYNFFHKSEWPYHNLKNILGSIFDEIEIFGQDWDTAKISSKNVRLNDFYIVVCRNT